MGIVFKAEDILLNEKVALKIFLKNTMKEEDFLRIKREISKGMKLKHKNLLKYYEIFEEENFLIAPMELVEGTTLKEKIKKENIKEDEIKRILKEMLDVLDYLHSEGVIHRDIKPSNIFIDQNGNLILGDLGIIFLENEEALTSTFEFIGTIHYMPPEAFDKNITPAYDYYSLGITLYEILTKNVPFEGTQAEIIKAHQLKKVPSLQKNIDKNLKKLIYGFLIKDPKKRWGKEELKKYLGKKSLPILPEKKRNIFYSIFLFVLVFFATFISLKLKTNEITDLRIKENKIIALGKEKKLWENTISFKPIEYKIIDIDSDGKKEIFLNGFHILNFKNKTKDLPIYKENGEKFITQEVDLRPLSDHFFDFPKIYNISFSLINLLNKNKKDLLINFTNNPFYPSTNMIFRLEDAKLCFSLTLPGKLLDIKKNNDNIAWYAINHKFLHLMTIGLTENYLKGKIGNPYFLLNDNIIAENLVKAYQFLEVPRSTKIDFSKEYEIYVTLSEGVKRKIYEDGTIEGQREGAGRKTLELLRQLTQVVRFLLSNELIKAEEIIDQGINISKEYKLTGYTVLFEYLKAELYLREGKKREAIEHCFKIYKEYPNYGTELPIIAGFYHYLNNEFEEAKKVWVGFKDVIKISAGKENEIYNYISFASMLSSKDEKEVIEEIESYKNIGTEGYWKEFLNYQIGWVKLLNKKPKEAIEILKGAIKEEGMEPNVSAYFLAKIILNIFDEKEYESYINGIGGEPYHIQWIGAVGRGDSEKAKILWKIFKNHSLHSQNEAPLLPLIERIKKIYPEKFSVFY